MIGRVTEIVRTNRRLEAGRETSHVFAIPTLSQVKVETLARAITRRDEILKEAAETLAISQAKIDGVAFNLYGVSDEDRQAIESGILLRRAMTMMPTTNRTTKTRMRPTSSMPHHWSTA